MRSKENIYLEKLVALERQLEDAEARADERVHKVREECNKEIEHYKVPSNSAIQTRLICASDFRGESRFGLLA